MKRFFRPMTIAGALFAVFFLSGFTDMPEEHWAYKAVTKLSAEGTVCGFEDGTFRPDAPVTRAQFVKMSGFKTETERNDISDLPASHWARDILVHSPLRSESGKIFPDNPMTREEAAVYLYDCIASGEGNAAPSVITNRTEYPSEIGWIYEHGIMIGDDGINLRLTDGVTRAEAAMLILNARQKVNMTSDFADNVPDEILKRVFNGSALFDSDYERDKTVTNGELAKAALRLRTDRVDALIYDEHAGFEHKYADDLKAMEIVLGENRISSEFADSPAMPEDAFSMIAYAMASKLHTPVSYGKTGDFYKDAVIECDSLDAPLTFAWQNGVRPYGNGVLKTGETVTHKVIAAVLLQYDILWGLQTSVTTDGEKTIYKDEPMRYSDMPKNAEVFQSIPISVPNSAADMIFRTDKGEETTLTILPKVNYAYCNDMRAAFVKRLGDISARLWEEYGVKVKFTYYPQLVYDNNSGLTVRTKAEITEIKNVGITAETIFSGCYTDTLGELRNGEVIWADIPLSYTFFAE